MQKLARRAFGSDQRQAVVGLVSLIYLLFLFIPALAPGMGRPGWLAYTLISLPPFLALYVASWRTHGPWAALPIAAMGAMGLVLLPVNPAAHTYVIFAVAAASGALTVGATIVLGGTLLLSYVLWHLHLGYPAMVAVFTCVLSLAIALGNVLATAYGRKDAALKLSQEEVRQLARVAERERIGRDLHDLLGHTLSVIVLKAELANRLYDRDADAARREMAEVERVARETLGQVRRAVMGIRAAGLRAELAGARLALDALGIELEQQIDTVILPPDFETALALVLREAITNCVRHSGARQVRVRLAAGKDEFRLSIEDDGKGTARNSARNDQTGTGIDSMRERVEALDGRFDWESDNSGTRLQAVIPRPTDGSEWLEKPEPV
ncbi:MAG: sensor histidine kinase [Lysobacterales bacterium]